MKLKRILALLMSAIIIFTVMGSAMPFAVFGLEDENPNLALNKPTDCSGIELEGYNFESPSSVDGNMNTRWSSNKDILSDIVWLSVDLEKPTVVGQINISWQLANSRDYNVEISDDGENWKVLKQICNPTQEVVEFTQKIAIPETVTTRYIRIKAYEGNYASYGAMPNISIFEIEVYAKPDVTDPVIPTSEYNEIEIPTQEEPEVPDFVSALKDKAPTISADGKKLILPELEGFKVSLYGSDNQQVIDLDGNIYEPLNDTTVSVMYQIQSIATPEFVQGGGDFNFEVKIPGKYKKEANDNEMPDVLPSLREWKGAQGYMNITSSSAIVLKEDQYDTLLPKAEQIQEYFKTMLNFDISIKKGAPSAGDIYLVMDKNVSEL